MKAVVIHAQDDLRVEDVPAPELRPDKVIVDIHYAGICGSDLAYWRHGATGTAILREPMILGHEISGVVSTVGDDVSGVVPGEPVTIHPATYAPGGHLDPRLHGRLNLYVPIRYFGSAAFLPHEQGGLCEQRLVDPSQLRRVPDTVSLRDAAVAEPFGVALHAVNRSGGVDGLQVLVNGAGPVGLLVASAAKAHGAARIWVSDINPLALRHAQAMGADVVVDLSSGDLLPEDVDVAFEVSGAPAALHGVFGSVRRGGTVVQVGNVPARPVESDLGNVVTKEIEYRGSYRFIDEIQEALELMASGVDVSPIVTHEFPIDDAVKAFETAGDRSTGSSKVLITF
jgi:L-idonate 5-dehydrogenase